MGPKECGVLFFRILVYLLTPTGLQWNIGLTDEHVETRSSLREISDLLVALGLLSLVDLATTQVDFELVLNNPQEPVGMVCVYSKNVYFTAEAVWQGMID